MSDVDICGDCHGTGEDPLGPFGYCRRCKGSGLERVTHDDDDEPISEADAQPADGSAPR